VQTNQYFAPYAIILQQLYFFIILVTISYSFYSKHQKPKTSLPVRTGSGFSIYMYVIYYCDSKISNSLHKCTSSTCGKCTFMMKLWLFSLHSSVRHVGQHRVNHKCSGE